MTQRTGDASDAAAVSAASSCSSSAAVFALLAIAAIGVTSWVLDVAADAPSLASCKPIDKRRQLGPLRRRRQQAGRDRLRRSAHPGLDRAHPQERAAGDGGDRGPALLRARRRRPRGHPPRRAQGPRSRRGGRGRLDDHPAAGPQPLHRRTRSGTSNARSSRRSWRSSTRSATRASEILGQYLNIASYGTIEGSTAVGVQAASRIYFSKPVWKLSLAAGGAAGRAAAGALRIQPDPQPGDGARTAQPGAAADGRSSATSARERAAAAERAGLGLDVSDDYFEHRQPYFFDYVENELIDELRRQHGAPRRARRCRRRSTPTCSGSAWKRCARPCPTRPTPPRRWSRSTPATATSGRWSRAPTTPRASSTSPPRGTASPARPSRPSC